MEADLGGPPGLHAHEESEDTKEDRDGRVGLKQQQARGVVVQILRDESQVVAEGSAPTRGSQRGSKPSATLVSISSPSSILVPTAPSRLISSSIYQAYQGVGVLSVGGLH